MQRFVIAQESTYKKALAEIKNGRKVTHWMWFIFPQIAGLGNSTFAKLYALKDLKEAQEYLQHPLLGHRLIEVSKAVLAIEDKSAHEIFGSPDDMKLRSCMTLFSLVRNSDPVFDQVLSRFFNGEKDPKTIAILENQ